MTYIAQCLAEYQKLFPTDWISRCSWSEADGTRSLREGIAKIDGFIETCVVLISRSVLSGEYILKNEIERDLEAFEDYVKGDDYCPEIGDVEQPQLKLQKKYQELDANLYIVVKKYRQLRYLISNKISLRSRRYRVNAISLDGRQQTLAKFDGVQCVFLLCHLDHMLSYGDDVVEKLILTYEHLLREEGKQSEQLRPIYRILKEKCAFLLTKMVYLDGTAEYAIDFKVKQIDLNAQSQMFKQFDSYFKFFHREECYDRYLPIVNDWEQHCTQKRASFAEMVLLMKFYKDSADTSSEQIENLYSEFADKMRSYQLENANFNLYALHMLRNYMYNCRLSFRIRHGYSFDALRDDMADIEKLQVSTGVKNFYPYRKAIQFLLNDIKTDLAQCGSVDQDRYEEKSKCLLSYIRSLERSIEWCQEHRFYPIQNIYEECVVQDASSGYDVFVASSFSRPMKYEKLQEELQSFKLDFKFLEHQKLLYEERVHTEQLKAEMASYKKSNIEILGAFTAVITFLFGCVNLFGESDVDLQLLNIGSVGLILLLFGCVIYILVMPKEPNMKAYFKHPRFYIFGICSILYIAILAHILWNVIE